MCRGGLGGRGASGELLRLFCCRGKRLARSGANARSPVRLASITRSLERSSDIVDRKVASECP